MARPCLSWSQRLASCSLLFCVIHTMSWIVKAGDLESSADLASCDELQCAHNNVCLTSTTNGTQTEHARCLCRGQWAGLRCRAKIHVHIATVSTESVTLRVKGHGPPHWGIELRVEELLIQELSVTYWNLNRSEDCNVLFTSQPRSRIRVEGLDKGQDFLFCIGNGPSDLCSLGSLPKDVLSISRRPNCIKVRTKFKEDVPLDIGLIVVPISCVIFIIFICIFIYCKRHSLCIHFILHFCCCRTCYCCRKRCLRRKLQHMRKQQQKQQESSGNLLHHETSGDPSLNVDLSVASTSLSSSAIGKRSSIVSGSYRSAKSVDSDATMPPAYQDEVSVFHPSDPDAYVPYENFPFLKRRVSETSFPNFSSETNNWDFLFPKEDSVHTDETPIHFRPDFSFKGPSNNMYPENKYSQFPVLSNDTNSYQPWTAYTALPLSKSFPIKSRTMPGKIRQFPRFEEPIYPSTVVDNHENPYEHFFCRPTHPTVQDDPGKSSLQNVPFDANNPQTVLNAQYSTATFPRRKKEPMTGSSTLPRVHSRKRDAQHFPAECPARMVEMFYPLSGLNQEMAFDRLTLPPSVFDVPETALPSKDSDEITSLPSKDSDEIKSTDSKDDKVPRKRVRSLIGHFERSLPFLKPSNSARPNSVHWEDEAKDFTSPLAVERSKGKKKRPRPWSLPADFDSRPVARRNQRRSQKPIFDEHPSLHVLPPFTTDEDEEEEAWQKDLKKDKKLALTVENKSENVEKVNAPAPCLKKDKALDSFISSYEDDVRNLVTPFICEEYEDEGDSTNEIGCDDDVTVRLNGDM